MERQHYLPRPNDAFNLWLQNLAAKISNYATKYGVTTEEVKDVQNFAADFDYRNNACNQVEGFGKQWTAYRNALRYGVPEGSTVQAPVAPALSPVTPVVAPGGSARVTNLISRIKNNGQ